jgi:hypothetical protein
VVGRRRLRVLRTRKDSVFEIEDRLSVNPLLVDAAFAVGNIYFSGFRKQCARFLLRHSEARVNLHTTDHDCDTLIRFQSLYQSHSASVLPSECRNHENRSQDHASPQANSRLLESAHAVHFTLVSQLFQAPSPSISFRDSWWEEDLSAVIPPRELQPVTSSRLHAIHLLKFRSIDCKSVPGVNTMRFSHYLLVLSALLLVVGSTEAQEALETLPKVLEHGEPYYPPIARTAHIVGEVRVKITTDGESVVTAEAESGSPLLRKAAEDNTRTWKFAPHTPGTFHVLFRYRFIVGNQEVEFLHSPGTVEIVATPPTVIVDYADIDLGEWRAELKSVHGKSSETFSLYYTGPPDGVWLGGRTRCPKDECDEIDHGYIKNGLIGFTIELTHPDGQRTTTFLVGKITGDKIVGSFVDDSGVRGEWKAMREK